MNAASGMTVNDWFNALDPAPPAALAAELDALLSDHRTRPARELPEICMEVAEQELATLLTQGSSSRESALRLLTIDALVTYAFEAAAADASQLDARTSRAMYRIGALGEPAVPDAAS